MNIVVVGAGHGGTTIAADLKLKGHKVNLLKTSKSLHNEHYNFLKEHNGEVDIIEDDKTSSVQIDLITTDIELALKDTELVIVYVQTNFHEQIINRLLPYLNPNHVVLLEPGYLSTAYFLKHSPDFEFTVVEAQSSPIDCRIINPGTVKVLFKNVRNPVAIYQNEVTDLKLVKSKLDRLDYNFEYLETIIEAALHNPNLIVHTIGGIMSMPRIEFTKGDYWMYKEVFTPHVWNMVESLDDEKMNVLEAIGANRVPYVDACKNRNAVDLSINSKEAFLHYAKNSSPHGPVRADSRFITEDVPEGLVLLESLGSTLGIKTPTCTGLINIANASLSIDFRESGRTVDRLGLVNIKKIIGTRSKQVLV